MKSLIGRLAPIIGGSLIFGACSGSNGTTALDAGASRDGTSLRDGARRDGSQSAGDLAVGDGTPSDSSTTASDGPNTLDGSSVDSTTAPSCTPLGGACSVAGQCCGGGACTAVGGDQKHCVADNTCLPSGLTCQQATDCCSLRCGAQGRCEEPPSGGGVALCTPSGSDAESNRCTADGECCSNDCDETTGLCRRNSAGSCHTLGERCATEGFDGSCCSKLCANFGSEQTPQLRCARSSICGARGELCSTGDQCCSGICQDDGRCPTQSEIGGTGFVGEPCQNDRECATRACAPSVVGGPSVCQALGGCRPAGDGSSGSSLCEADWQCCGYAELSSGATQCLDGADVAPGAACVEHSVAGLRVCALQTTDKEVGEICKFAEDMNRNGELEPETELFDLHNCCCADGVDCCVPSSAGVYRCRGGAYTPGSCKAQGAPCQISDECCSNICVPRAEGGGFVCSDRCVPDGLQCSRSADCCGFSCVGGRCRGGPKPEGDGGIGDGDGGAGDGGATGSGDAGPRGDGGRTGLDGGAASDAAASADAGVPEPVCRPYGASCSESRQCCTELCSRTTGSCTFRLY